LEHIPDLNPVIKEIARVLKPGALFVFCVPNHRFLDALSISRWFKSLRLNGLSKRYRRFFNTISRHYHCDSLEVWEQRLRRHGFVIEDYWDYFSPQALRTLEWGHYFGVPAWVSKKIFNQWILVPRDWNLFLTDLLVRPHYERDSRSENGVYSFYITRYEG
jgi:SAM-dependent methyltransferase